MKVNLLKRNKLWLLGFFGFIGIVGIALSSATLSSMLAFFAFFALLPFEDKSDLSVLNIRSANRAFALGIFLFGTVLLFAAILKNVPMIIDDMPLDILLLFMTKGIGWAYAITIVFYILQVVLTAYYRLYTKKMEAYDKELEIAYKNDTFVVKTDIDNSINGRNE